MAGFTKRALSLAACGLAAVAVAAPSTHASVPPTDCGTIKVEGKKYRVKGHLVSCDFAVRWSKHFLKAGHRPDGWTCIRYSAEESSIAFNCRKGGKDYYAVRK